MASQEQPSGSCFTTSRSTRKAKGKLVAIAPCKPRQKAKTMDGVTYQCPTCFKEFDNAQALGGHQNAHRKEREEEESKYRESRRNAYYSYGQPAVAVAAPRGYLLGARPQIWYGPMPSDQALQYGGQYGMVQANMAPMPTATPAVDGNLVHGGVGNPVGVREKYPIFEFMPASSGVEISSHEDSNIELDLNLHL